MRGQLVELRAGARITMGGSSESAANDWQVKPTGSPSSSAVTIVMPVAKWPSTSRNRAWSRPVTRAAYALPRSIDWDSCAEDTSSTCLASGSRRAWFRMRSSSRSVCDGSWCESSSRLRPDSAATCTA